MANLGGLTAAEVGFLVVRPFKKHTFLASGKNGGQTGNTRFDKCNETVRPGLDVSSAGL